MPRPPAVPELPDAPLPDAPLPDHFAGVVAATYDEVEAEEFAPAVVDRTVALLAELAAGGRVLELGIGTGRVALPLRARGVPVHGIDLSGDMLAQLRRKPGAERITLTEGDFATTLAGHGFALAYLVFNTIGNLVGQDQQVACFETVAAQLAPGGCFLVEVGVPDLRRLPPGETVRPFALTADRLGFDVYDVARQGLVSHHHRRLASGQWAAASTPFRYVWPAELDLMARIAGLRLRERWQDWDRTPFTSDSEKHVSVWELPA